MHPKSHDSANLNLKVRNSPNLKEKKKFESHSTNLKIELQVEFQDQISSRIRISSEFESQHEFNAAFDKKIEIKSPAVAKVHAAVRRAPHSRALSKLTPLSKTHAAAHFPLFSICNLQAQVTGRRRVLCFCGFLLCT